MPLTDKGKEIKNKMVKHYGKKKGESVFYAMENSGKLRKVVKARGGMDASKGDFGKEASARDAGMGMSGKVGFDKGVKGNTGNGGNNPPAVTAKKGPFQVPTIGPLTAGFNVLSRSLYNTQNLKEARKDDILGGEMLTTGQKTTGPAGNMGGDGGRQMCPDGTVPPCKSPTTYTPPAAQAKPNTFLSGFQAYEDGGEVIVSANVDEDLL